MAHQISVLDSGKPHTFTLPVKRINDGPDVQAFLVSKGYRDITTFLVQLNRAMFPKKQSSNESKGEDLSASISILQSLLKAIDALVDEVPLDPGTHRFGNTAYRKWFQLLEQRSRELLEQHLPLQVQEFPHSDNLSAIDELQAYLLGSFGSAQRLDYGTGHELSFLAFLAGIWKLGGFQDVTKGVGEEGIVCAIIDPYLILVRKLILKYSLEPAGSHGVWGLDDHSFLPYIFGSAQYGPEITGSDLTPVEGSMPDAPKPGDIVKPQIVERERTRNLYFGAIGFIYDVKKGPFWEHSPTLFDISGVQAGWAKINKGMLKMFNAEVLSKFPVVQHFPFGSLFSFERDPEAEASISTIHTASQPIRNVPSATSQYAASSTTAAPWATTSVPGSSTAPWAQPRTSTLPIGRNDNSSSRFESDDKHSFTKRQK